MIETVSYKIITCDVCGKRKKFDTLYTKPMDWSDLKDDYGRFKYPCLCPQCAERIKGYIEEYKSLHYQDNAEVES